MVISSLLETKVPFLLGPFQRSETDGPTSHFENEILIFS